MKFKIIKTDKQYFKYCRLHEELSDDEDNYSDELEILELLVEQYDRKHSICKEILSSVDFLKSLMVSNELTPLWLVLQLNKENITTETIEAVLTGQEKISEDLAFDLSQRFKVESSAFLKD